MSGSVLKEVTFTPQSFEKNFIFSNKRRFGKLISILESLIDGGIIVGVSKNWKNEVYTFLNNYDDYDKDELSSLLKELDTRNRIALYPAAIDINNEQGWINKIKELDQKRKFDFAVGSINSNMVTIIDAIDKEKYINSGAKIKKQTLQNIGTIVAPILSSAEIIQIFDPYFKINEKRFFDVLDLVCKNLGNMYGIKSNAIVDIHTSVKTMLNYNKKFEWNRANEWKSEIKKLEDKYNHKITIKIWEETKKNKWHDRWMITNQCGLFMGKGSDESSWTDSTWGLLNWNELSVITSKFSRGRGFYHLIAEVNASGINKISMPKDVDLEMSKNELDKFNENLKNQAIKAEEERIEKLKNPISIKERMERLRQKKEK